MQNQHSVGWGPYNLGYTAHTLAFHPKETSGNRLHLACGSFILEAPNFVDVLSLDVEGPDVVRSAVRLPHYFPPTRLKWFRPSSDGGIEQDLLVTSGDAVRVWSSSGQLHKILPHKDNPKGLCTPITSVDSWNPNMCGSSPAHIVSCDVYGICALWDVHHGALKQAFQLDQPLHDVAFCPDGRIAVAGDDGSCFLIDPRAQFDALPRLGLRERVRGPARIAVSSQGSNLISIAWQGEEGGLALYDSKDKRAHRLLQSASRGSATADLQWSPTFPELLCCAKECGMVEVWQIPENGTETSSAVARPCFEWQPRRGEVCTSLALSPQVAKKSLIVVSTIAEHEFEGQGPVQRSSLWAQAFPETSHAAIGSGLGQA